MTRRAREIETLLLAMFAAVPLYFTYSVGTAPLIAFHAAMAAIALRVAMGKGPELLPAKLMRVLAVLYVPFYVVDWIAISGTAMAASTHLVLFIAVYQPVEGVHRPNQAQRMLTTALIFVASLSTSTHITIVAFVVVFAWLMFRQLMYVSHLESIRSVERPYAEAPSGGAAVVYVAGAAVIAAVLFPFLPRLRNPLVQGFAASLPNATTALSETIDFNEQRYTPPDATVVARVWMNYQTRPFFSPMRLRGTVYDHYRDGEWRQEKRGLRPLSSYDGAYRIARPGGIARTAVVQHRPQQGRVFLPVGTYEVSGLSTLYEGAARDSYFTYEREMLTMNVRMAIETRPLRATYPLTTGYPVTPEIATLARAIVGGEQRPERRAALIEQWMVSNFRYVANPGTVSAMSIEQFLLKERAGHCEYFAAGMVVLLTALDVPARIAGGFYGGRYNPLTGYFTVRRDDAHAWTEVWNGQRWVTYDSTPPALRPGSNDPSVWRSYVAALADSVNYFWDRYILTFGLGDQVTFFTDALTWIRNTANAAADAVVADFARLRARAPLFLLALALALAAGVSVLLFRGRGRPFDLLAARLRAHGIEVGPSMTVEDALRELRASDPELAARFAPAVTLYEEEEFSSRPDRGRRRELRRRLAALRA